MKMMLVSVSLFTSILISSPGESREKSDDTSDSSIKVVSASGGLRMRSGPKLNGQVLGIIPEGAPVEVLEVSGEAITVSGRTGKWSRVLFDGKSGWVFGGFLSEPVNGSLALLEIFPFTGRLKSLSEARQGEYHIQESCDSALYHELTLSCRRDGNYLVQTHGLPAPRHYCELDVRIGRNQREMSPYRVYRIIGVEKRGDTYTLLSDSSERFMITWPADRKDVMLVDKKPYAVPGADFPVRDARCDQYRGQ